MTSVLRAGDRRWDDNSRQLFNISVLFFLISSFDFVTAAVCSFILLLFS